MQDFDYVAARSIDEVVSVLASDGDQVRILSGGTDLLVQLREGRKRAKCVVDIKRIPDLCELTFSPAEGLRIGAAVPCHQLCEHPDVAQYYPGLVDAASLIGGTQIQGRATLGGNLCNASPAADSIPALIVHRAVAEVAGPDGRRDIPVEEFCTAPGINRMGKGEFLVALRLPPPPPGFGAGYLRFIPRNEMDIAVVGAGAALTLTADGTAISDACVALGAVAPTPLWVSEAGQFLKGKAPTVENFRHAALIAREAARPINDMRGTIEQRRHLSAVLTRRALERAFERARAPR